MPNRSRTLAASLPLAVLALAAAGCAVTKTPYSRNGFYAGATAIASVSSFDDVDGADLGDSDVVGGIGLRGGFRFHDQFAAEVVYEGNQEFEFDNSVDVESQTFSVNGKFYPTTGRVQPYVLAGIGQFDGEIDAVSFDEAEIFYRLGFGVEGYLSRYVAAIFELDWNQPTGDLDELTYSAAQLGVLFRF
jgi:hypothetical protein